ncbi:MAG TPA: conjugal transfer protein TraX [Lachnospiraceae bacterium]|nr:conjugal transfer protein TraX [Lachnospiraceae bacterium]
MKTIKQSTLKYIAIITMFIDHIGAFILRHEVNAKYPAGMKMGDMPGTGDPLLITYFIIRAIGRLAFPLFCFMLVEGLFHTKSKFKYATRLLIFALISEVPFDLANKHEFWYPKYQNVFFTLFLGMVAIWGLSYAKQEMKKCITGKETSILKFLSPICVAMLVSCSAVLLADEIHTDYGMGGVLCIIIMYLIYDMYIETWTRNKAYCMTMLSGVVVLASFNNFEAFAFLDVALIAFYWGERGKVNKYFFYAFYPAHILVLYFACRYILG